MKSKNKLKLVIVAIGDELMADQVDTNGPAMTKLLNNHGFNIGARLVLPDQLLKLTSTLKSLHRSNQLIICCGGLGPTLDDVTRQAIAKALNVDLITHRPSLLKIHKLFKLRNLVMPNTNQQQALIPYGAEVLTNHQGTAPGFLIGHKQHWIAALPGPPKECLTMLKNQLIPKLKKLFTDQRASAVTRAIRVVGQSESRLQEIISPIMKSCPKIALGFLITSPGDILIKLSLSDKYDQRSLKQLKKCVHQIKTILGPPVIDTTGKSLEQVVGNLLIKNNQTLAIAESCTGGLICSRLISIAGSSRYIKEGVVTYSNQSKIKRLGVLPSLIKRYGAVSQQVAMAMATGVRKASRVDWGLAITGLAGPGGGSLIKPVGTVYIAVAGPNISERHCKLHWTAERVIVQQWASTLALDTLRRSILNLPVDELR